jgi:hypothetical protein
MQYYTPQFYQTHAGGSRHSAEIVLPHIVKLINPKSVIDIGCGIGTWISFFKDKNIEKFIGVDGDYVDRNQLLIPKENFIPHDLTKPFKHEEKYDLVISLEVAEHIEEQFSDIFIDTLTGLGDVVLFSAAIPWQRALTHVNEQWQEYWAAKFKKRGYLAVDCIRKKVWQEPDIEIWYAQNIIVYATKEALDKYPLLKSEYEINKDPLLSVVHPRFFLERSDAKNYYLSDIVSAIPAILKKFFKRKFSK